MKIVGEAVSDLDCDGRAITAIRFGGKEHRFDVLYSALGTKVRSDLAVALGAEHDENGALIVGEHCETTVPNLYAAGDVVRGLSQVVVGMGHAAIASTDVHNHCGPATQYEENRPHSDAAE